MRKFFVPTAAISLAALALAVVVFVTSNSLFAAQTNTGKTIHVVEHAITDTVVDVNNKGDALGNILAFANPVFDVADKKQVGSDNGHCIRTVVGKAWECFWTVFLPAGQITVEGPFFDNGTDSMLAITGGTAAYRDARGQMRLHARGNPVGSEFDFIYMLD